MDKSGQNIVDLLCNYMGINLLSKKSETLHYFMKILVEILGRAVVPYQFLVKSQTDM